MRFRDEEIALGKAIMRDDPAAFHLDLYTFKSRLAADLILMVSYETSIIPLYTTASLGKRG